MKDVLIEAPPMTPNGSVLMTDAEVREFNKDYQNLKNVTDSFATALCALVLLHNQDGTPEDEVRIPFEMMERVKGTKIEISQDGDQNLILKLVDRAPALFVVEGR